MLTARFKGRLLFRITLYWGLYHVVLWHAVFVYRYMQQRMSGAVFSSATSFAEMYDQQLADYYPIILCAIITLPVVFVDMLKMTHRLCGPLLRYRDALRNLVAGKPVEHVTLRKDDLLTEFQDEFNQYLEVLAQRRNHGESKSSVPSESSGDEEAQVLSQVNELRETIQGRLVAQEAEMPEEQTRE